MIYGDGLGSKSHPCSHVEGTRAIDSILESGADRWRRNQLINSTSAMFDRLTGRISS